MNLKKFFFNFVLFIPVLFAIALNTTGYFSPRGLNPGTIRGFIMVLFLFFFLIKYYPGSLVNRVIFIFTLYIGILSLTSSGLSTSLYGFMKFAIASFMFPLGYYFINNHDKLIKLSRFYVLALGIFMFNIILANIFGLGSSDYLEDSLYFGAGRVNITKSTIILIFAGTILAYSHDYKYKKLLTTFLVIASIFTIIGIKRSVLLAAISGFLIFSFTSRSKITFIKSIIVLSIIIIGYLAIFPATIDIFLDRYEARGEKMELTDETLDKEARYNETNLVLNAWLTGSLKHKVFGSEIFNDASFFNSRRMLHTDYMVVLAGSGLVGIIFWFLIYYLMIREKEKYWKLLKYDSRFYYYRPVFYSILAGQMLMSISGTIQGIDLRSFILLFLGALIGSLRGEYLIKMKKLSIQEDSVNQKVAQASPATV